MSVSEEARAIRRRVRRDLPVALSAAAAPLLTNDAKRRTTARVLSALLALVALWFAWKTRG